MNKQKTCVELKAELDRGWSELHTRYSREIATARNREFPIGAKVKFQHGLKWLDATVIEHGRDWAPEKIVVRNDKTGRDWDLEVHRLHPR